MHIAQPTGAACRLILHQQQPATYLGLQKTHQQLTFWLYGCSTETPSWREQECLTQNCGVWNRCRVFGQSPEGACSASITWDVLLIIPVQLEHWKLYLKQQSPRFRWDINRQPHRGVPPRSPAGMGTESNPCTPL